MDYEDLVKEIKAQGITKLPALLVVIAEQCVIKHVFQPGGMERVISRVASQQVVQDGRAETSSNCHYCGRSYSEFHKPGCLNKPPAA